MPAISQQIPNLLGGASQQPDPVKLPGQVREAKNVYLDPTFGCKKRPPLKWEGQLATNIPKVAKWFPMIRDETERYLTCMYAGANDTAYYVVTVDSNKFKMDGGSANATLTLTEGDTIIFDQGHSSNTGKPLRISTTSDGTHGGGAEYTTNVITYGTPGKPGAFTKITKLATSAPTLYYYDTSTASAGGQLTTSAVGSEPTDGWPTRIRVWDAKNGFEQKVTLKPGAIDYLKVQKDFKGDINEMKTLTVNDFTFISNPTTEVTMDTASDTATTPEALVVINQVAYNTTYGIDFLRDGTALTTVEENYATKISVSPATWTDQDAGACSKANTQSYTLNHSSDNTKTGLGFTLNTRCANQQTQADIVQPTYPNRLIWFDPKAGPVGEFDYHLQAWATYRFSKKSDEFSANHHEPYEFTYTTSNGKWIKVKVQIKTWVDPDILDGTNGTTKMPNWDSLDEDEQQDLKDQGGLMRWKMASWEILDWEPATSVDDEWETEIRIQDQFLVPNVGIDIAGGWEAIGGQGKNVGIIFKISDVKRPDPTTDYGWESRYTANVTLTNGGAGWDVGDTVTQTMSGQDYTIRVEETSFRYTYASDSSVTYTTPANTAAGTLDVAQIASNLTTDIIALSGYTASTIGNVIHIKRDGDTREFNLMTRGGTADNALYGIKGSVRDITMLPDQCTPGVILKVRNTAESDDDDYYVKFKSADGDGDGSIPGHGSWEETVKPGSKTDINAITMPHALIRLANGHFEFRSLSAANADDNVGMSWKGRMVGDWNEETKVGTNPPPSFVGQTISNMFFFMNRLGFLTEDSVCLSQPSDIFNFFNSSAIALSDADPIDMTASATKPAILKAALGTPRGLLLFAENSQFLLATSEAAFGPSTVKMTEISNYAYTSKIAPVETGVSVMFPTEADTFTKVFEMAVDSIDNRPVVSENTRIIPEYIPPNLTFATASVNNSFVVFGDDSNELYTFKYFNVGNDRSLAGWAKWVLPAPCRLMVFVHDTSYVIMYHSDSYTLSSLEMLDDPDVADINISGQNSRFLPRLDNYISSTNITKVTGATKTKLYFPTGSYVPLQTSAGTYIPAGTATVVYTSQGESTLYERPEVQSDSDGYFVEVANDDVKVTDIAGNVINYPFIMGMEYDFEIELPSFHVTREKRADRRNPPMVENVYLDLYLSGRYSITLKRLGYTDRNFDLEVNNADIYLADAASIKEVITKAIPVYVRGDHAHITVKASDPLPASITSYSWEGHYNNRGIQTVA